MPDKSRFPKGHWAFPVLNRDRQGDPDCLPIYCAVGNVLTVWEMVEEALADLFLEFLRIEKREMQHDILRVYGTIENTTSRAAMVTTAAELYFRDAWGRKEIREPFDSLIDDVKTAAHRRNEIAHGKTGWFQEGFRKEPTSEPELATLGFLLVAPDYITKRNLMYRRPQSVEHLGVTQSNYGYSSNDIREMSQKFMDLRREIVNYTKKISEKIDGKPKIIVDLEEADAQKAAEREARKTLWQSSQQQAPPTKE
jgi:hypothetical protein